MWVSPFRDLRVNGYLLLTAAYRSLSRLSSALSAKASTLRSSSLDLLAAVLHIELVDDVQERRKVIVRLIGTVHTAVDGDESDIVFRKKHFRINTDFQIVSADTAHVFGNENANLVVLHHADHALPIGSVES